MPAAARIPPRLARTRAQLLQVLGWRGRQLERGALLHTLANMVGIITANVEALRELQTDPEALRMMDDVALAAERAHRTFEALRRLG